MRSGPNRLGKYSVTRAFRFEVWYNLVRPNKTGKTK